MRRHILLDLIYWKPVTGAFSFRNITAILDGPLFVKVSFTDLAENTGEDTVTFTVFNQKIKQT